MKQKIVKLVELLLILLISIIIVGSIYYKYNYGMQDFEEILFYAQNGGQHASDSVVNSVLKTCVIPIILIVVVLYTIPNIYNLVQDKFTIKIRTKRINVFKWCYEHKKIYITILLIISFAFLIVSLKVHKFIWNKVQQTKLYDDYYINGETVNINFPEKKRNLIIIFAESMETTFCSKQNGGAWEYSIIPELEKLALENINFSNKELLGGAKSVYGTTFTTGGMVAQTAGIPVITHTSVKNCNTYKGNGNYFSGANTLGEILQKQGYNLEIMMGSDGDFGGRTQYFTTNGNYKIFDYNYAIETGKMQQSDYTWWGFQDDKLFDWSKEEITKLAEKKEPFNYIMLTADTHFVDGYLSEYAEEKFETQYENVYAYSSKLINEFILWAKEQEFFENTTIVVIGDHLGMQEEFYNEHINDKQYERTTYNVFINSAVQKQNSKNRIFTTMDLFPTILASIGVTVEGEQIGLGTNLFSGKATISEKLGYNFLNEELKKTSLYYNQKILGEDYYVIRKNELLNK